MHKFKKKRLALGALGLLVVAGAAFAYFTTTGEGEGTATVGNTEGVTVTATGPEEALYPLNAAPANNTTIALKNEGKGVVKVKEVVLKELTTNKEHCEPGWFEFVPAEFNEEIEPGHEAEAEGTLWLKNAENVNQDACKTATVTAKYKVVSE